MTFYILTHKAKADLITIARYTEKRWGRKQRMSYLKQIDDAFKMLIINPNVGVECSFIASNYRKLPIGSHVIYYHSIKSDHIEVVRVLHKSIDVNIDG